MIMRQQLSHQLWRLRMRVIVGVIVGVMVGCGWQIFYGVDPQQPDNLWEDVPELLSPPPPSPSGMAWSLGLDNFAAQVAGGGVLGADSAYVLGWRARHFSGTGTPLNQEMTQVVRVESQMLYSYGHNHEYSYEPNVGPLAMGESPPYLKLELGLAAGLWFENLAVSYYYHPRQVGLVWTQGAYLAVSWSDEPGYEPYAPSQLSRYRAVDHNYHDMMYTQRAVLMGVSGPALQLVVSSQLKDNQFLKLAAVEHSLSQLFYPSLLIAQLPTGEVHDRS